MESVSANTRRSAVISKHSRIHVVEVVEGSPEVKRRYMNKSTNGGTRHRQNNKSLTLSNI